MHRIARTLTEIAIGLSREYLSPRMRLRVLFAYYLARLRSRTVGKQGVVRFLGFSLSSRSTTNLLTILREVFVFGDYYFKAKTDAPIIVDCGGNIGISTIFFKWLYPKARITVLEPSRSSIESLRRNIETNGLENILVIEAAAAPSDGTLKFWESETRPGSSTVITEVHDTKALLTKHRFREYEVRAEKLSRYIGEQVDLLKMDIEGAEGAVIEELAKSDALRRIKTIILEYHDNKGNPHNELTRLLTTLDRNGFSTVIYNNDVGPSSEALAAQSARHFLVRADR
jgi:FkbM family methyltransferase